LRQVSGFYPGTPVSYTNKTDRHDITELLLQVALNTTNHKPLYISVPLKGEMLKIYQPSVSELLN
jgi:hypothetical protein